MADSSKNIKWVLLFLGSFLILDSVLALALGKTYMLWGLEYAPEAYRLCIRELSEYSAGTLLAIKLAEGLIGLSLILAAMKISHKTPG
ncbi:MAG: hypothetical protein WAX07_06585 [Candidatus Altiarchaeia archaeon]